MTPTARRSSGVAAAAIAAVALCSPAMATAPSASDAASAYLAGQLAASGNTLQTSSYPDYGLTADAILGLAASGTSSVQAKDAAATFEKNVASYDSYGTDRYAGATAKSAIVAETAGQNPRAFGGQNLVTTLQGLEATSGRFSDKSTYGDFSNTLTQSLAIIALHRAGAPVDAKAVTYLLSMRCADGGFKMMPDAKGCTSDSDATSFAVQALSAAGGHTADVTKAAHSLAARQGADGGIGGGVNTPGANANSTGLAAAAFRLAGDQTHATKATAYVRSVQYGCAAPASLRGAIAYDKADFTSVSASKKPLGNEVRSTAQAILAVTPATYLTTTIKGASATPSLDCSTAPVTTKPAPSSTKPAPATTKPTHTATSRPTATSTATAPATTATPTVVPTGTATASGTAPATATGTSSATSTGPVVNTDHAGTSSSSTLPLGLGGAAAVIAAAGAGVTYARRR